jgi:hypothetical protein
MVQGAYGHPLAAGHRAVARQWRQSGMHHHCRQNQIAVFKWADFYFVSPAVFNGCPRGEIP